MKTTSLTNHLKRLNKSDYTIITYDLFRILMNAGDGDYWVSQPDGATGETRVKLDKILASIGFEENWNKPGYAQEMLEELQTFVQWKRDQKKVDMERIQRVLDIMFNTPLPLVHNGERKRSLAHEVALAKTGSR